FFGDGDRGDSRIHFAAVDRLEQSIPTGVLNLDLQTLRFGDRLDHIDVKTGDLSAPFLLFEGGICGIRPDPEHVLIRFASGLLAAAAGGKDQHQRQKDRSDDPSFSQALRLLLPVHIFPPPPRGTPQGENRRFFAYFPASPTMTLRKRARFPLDYYKGVFMVMQ